MKTLTQVPKVLTFAVSMILATGALADDHRHSSAPVIHHVDPRGAAWGHGDIRHFHDFDFHAWRGGHWVHDWHNNHFGWWWVVGGAWVFFTVPAYPYPDPYVPSTVIVQTAPDAAAAPPPAAPAPAYWYYCASAQNYYPYVTQCPVGWEPVPATPPAAPAAAPPAAPAVPPPGTPPPPPATNGGTW